MDFVLAEQLGKSLAEVRAMPHAEYVEWAAFYTWRHAAQDHAEAVAAMRAKQ